jgi:hypothetical protein
LGGFQEMHFLAFKLILRGQRQSGLSLLNLKLNFGWKQNYPTNTNKPVNSLGYFERLVRRNSPFIKKSGLHDRLSRYFP